jgi:hypothetical protein
MKLFIVMIATFFCLSSCHHVYYAPNTPNAPLLSKKGESRINAFYAAGADSKFGGVELQFAPQ